MQKFLKTMDEWDQKNSENNFINQQEFYEHFSEYPWFAKFMWFGYNTYSNGALEISYNGVKYEDLTELVEKNPAQIEEGPMIGFKYLKLINRTIVFEKES